MLGRGNLCLVPELTIAFGQLEDVGSIICSQLISQPHISVGTGHLLGEALPRLCRAAQDGMCHPLARQGGVAVNPQNGLCAY